jgi:prepilin-type N-terminal cleavage/methylation domain-containing protein
MWTADRATASGERGLSLIELTMTLAVLGLMSLLVERTMATVRDTSLTLQEMNQVESRCVDVAYELQEEICAARKMFYRGTEATKFQGLLELGAATPSPGTRLPLPDEISPLGPDEDVPRTGNVLMFVREADPYVLPADTTLRKVRYVDVYQFVCIYPSESDERRIVTRDARVARDLVVWKSVGFPSYSQIQSIQSTTERARVVRALYSNHGYRHAWNAEAPAELSFHALDASGSVASTGTGPAIRRGPDSPGGRLGYAGFQLGRTDATSYARRALLTRDDPASWVPDGLEVKVTGPSGNRQVWIRLTLESQSATSRDVAHTSTLVATLHDL